MKLEVELTPKIKLHAEGETGHDIFRQIAAVQSTFEDHKCGLCGSENLQYVVREVEDNEFFELRCKDCYGKLSFGTSKADKKLYPKRLVTGSKGKAVKDEKTGKAIPLGKKKNGWVKYNPETGKEE